MNAIKSVSKETIYALSNGPFFAKSETETLFFTAKRCCTQPDMRPRGWEVGKV